MCIRDSLPKAEEFIEKNLFNEFIAELHSKKVYPLKANYIRELIPIINKAIEDLNKDETQITMENSLTFTIWKLASNLDKSKKETIIETIIEPILKNIITTLDAEALKIANRTNKLATVSRPVTAASRPLSLSLIHISEPTRPY